VNQLYAGQDPSGVEEALESEHRAHAAFYSPVTLFDNVVQVGTVSNLHGTVSTIIEFVIHTHAAQSDMGGLKAILRPATATALISVASCRIGLAKLDGSPPSVA
jgi:hypothetical protein